MIEWLRTILPTRLDSTLVDAGDKWIRVRDLDLFKEDKFVASARMNTASTLLDIVGLFIADNLANSKDQALARVKDQAFHRNQCADTGLHTLKNLSHEDKKKTHFLVEYRPQSDQRFEQDWSLAPLDCNLFASWYGRPSFLTDRLLPYLLGVHDHRQSASGVEPAIEGRDGNPGGCAFPILPRQGLLIRPSWFTNKRKGLPR